MQSMTSVVLVSSLASVSSVPLYCCQVGELSGSLAEANQRLAMMKVHTLTLSVISNQRW